MPDETPQPVPPEVVWSSTVRYAEVDQQSIVFNAHYLTYADEAMGAFCARRGILEFAERVHLVASTITWSSPARWGEVVDVTAAVVRVGTSSVVLRFGMSVGDRLCCTAETTYVHAIDGRSAPIPESTRAALS